MTKQPDFESIQSSSPSKSPSVHPWTVAKTLSTSKKSHLTVTSFAFHQRRVLVCTYITSSASPTNVPVSPPAASLAEDTRWFRLDSGDSEALEIKDINLVVKFAHGFP